MEKQDTPPHVHVPQTWNVSEAITTKQPVRLPLLLWWKQYRRPELDHMIEKALRENAQLKIGIANIELSRNQLEQIKLNWLPNLSILGGYSQFPLFGNPGGFAIAYPTYILNIIQQYKQQKSAEARYEASIYAKDSIRLTLIAHVAAGYFTLLSQHEALHLYSRLLQEEREYLKLVESQYRHGLISQDHVDEVHSQVQQILSQLALTKHYIAVSNNALHYLLNENPGAIDVHGTFITINSDAVIPGNLPASVLKARPDIREADALLKAAHADVGMVSANLLPTFSLGSYLGTSANQGGVHLDQAILTMPVIDLPIFAQIGAEKARYRMFLIQYIDTIRKALRDVSNDLSAYSARTLQLKKNISAYLSEERRCRLEKHRYQSGLVDQGRVLECRIKLIQFQLLLNQNKLEKLLASVTLFQDLAGGYDGH